MFNENEIWKPIPDFEGYYSVSNLGRVRSEARVVEHKVKSKQTLRERILKAGTLKNGYLFVVLCRNGQKKTFLVHRLVAMAFLEKSENKEQVNHINNIRYDNRLENLEWCTRSENMQHATKQGRSGGQKVAITEEVIQEMYKLLDQGLTLHQVAASIGVGHMTVWRYNQKRKTLEITKQEADEKRLMLKDADYNQEEIEKILNHYLITP